MNTVKSEKGERRERKLSRRCASSMLLCPLFSQLSKGSWGRDRRRRGVARIDRSCFEWGRKRERGGIYRIIPWFGNEVEGTVRKILRVPGGRWKERSIAFLPSPELLPTKQRLSLLTDSIEECSSFWRNNWLLQECPQEERSSENISSFAEFQARYLTQLMGW